MNPLENWFEEKRSAYLYQQLAIKEQSPNRKKLFIELETLANKQAAIWEKELIKQGKSIPTFKPDFRAKLVSILIRFISPQRLRFILSAMKVRGMSVYLNSDPNYPFSTVSTHHEHRHKSLTQAGNLRAAVFGINDGLVSNMSLILGIAGATTDVHFILLSGVAGMLAGACSMGAGEYISVRSQKEFYEYQINLERNELEQYPQEEAQELAAIYRARGVPTPESEKLAQLVISNPEKALETLAREELGLNPADLGSPCGAALASFLAFSIGAIIPLIPFFFKLSHGLIISMILTAGTLFGIGALLSFFNNQSIIRSGSRMLMIGAGAGIFTYLIGMLMGISFH